MFGHQCPGVYGVSPMRPNTTRTQLRDEAASYLRELITAGQVAPGDLLRLAPLAEQLGMSITPVRESLLLLARDGWVVQEPHRGFRVAQIRRQDVADTFLLLLLEFVSGSSRHVPPSASTRRHSPRCATSMPQSPDSFRRGTTRAQELNIEIHRLARTAMVAHIRKSGQLLLDYLDNSAPGTSAPAPTNDSESAPTDAVAA